MKVKIGNTIYDPNDQPIMVILTKEDKWNISNMDESATKHCAYPSGSDTKDIEDWMKDD